MKSVLVFVVFIQLGALLQAYSYQNAKAHNFTVNLTNSVAAIEQNFLSVAMDSEVIAKDLKEQYVPFTSAKFQALCEGLSKVDMANNRPHIYLRIGGSKGDNVIFRGNGLDSNEQYVLNHTEWDRINEFAMKFQWKLVFGLNSLLRRHDGSWDPMNAIEFMRYTKGKGYLVNYELGNGNFLLFCFCSFTTFSKL